MRPREALEARIARDRTALKATLGSLCAQARAGVDVRRHVREKPVPWLAGAMLIGWLWATRR